MRSFIFGKSHSLWFACCVGVGTAAFAHGRYLDFLVVLIVGALIEVVFEDD